MTHAFAAHLLLSHLHTTAVADYTLVTDTFVFAAMALVVLHRTEDLLTEKPVALRLVGAVVDCFRLQHLAARLLLDLLRRGKTDGDFREIAFNFIVSSKSHKMFFLILVCPGFPQGIPKQICFGFINLT